MEDDDDSHSSSASPSPPPHPISIIPPSSNDRPSSTTPPPSSATVTVAAPPHHSLTLALPIQPRPSSIPPSTTGGRDDCWSDGATSTLIDAWGERYLDLSRGNLKQKHWQEVADAVTSRDDYTKPPKSDVQCKNRIDTLKKKYKIEKSKISSTWPFFHRLDLLLGPNHKATSNPNPNNPPPPKGAAFPIRTKRSRSQSSGSEGGRSDSVGNSSDSLPPETVGSGGRRRRKGEGVRELTRAIVRFGEVYERVESSKIKQAVEMEKQRMGFARELELQRMQFFMTTQMELSQLERHHHHSSRRRRSAGGGGGGGSSDNHHHHHRRDVNNNKDDDNGNNTE